MACLALAALGALGVGFALGRFARRREIESLRDEIHLWLSLASELNAANGQLRSRLGNDLLGPAKPQTVSADGPNALGVLRTRLDFGRGEVAQGLGIPVADVDALEAKPMRLLEVGTVERYVGALGCRLDVVAVHIDGEAIWLSDERGAS